MTTISKWGPTTDPLIYSKESLSSFAHTHGWTTEDTAIALGRSTYKESIKEMLNSSPDGTDLTTMGLCGCADVGHIFKNRVVD